MKLDAVAKTALLVAAMRAIETNRSESEGRLFNDPFASALAGNEGFAIFEEARKIVGDQPAIAVRTFFYDGRISNAIQQGFKQFVFLAAGMDSRAYRLSFQEDTQLFELDRREVLDYKQKKLSGATPLCRRHAVAADLESNWEGELMNSGFIPNQPTVWLVEGLLMYLTEAAVETLFAKITKLSAPGSLVLFDVLGRRLLDAPFMATQLEYLAKMGAPWRFGLDEPELFMEKFGWTSVATEPGTVVPDRWPRPVTPRHVPNVPRSFFVEARKT